MKKLIWIATLMIAAATSGFAQQDVYHDEPSNDDVYYNDNTNDQDNDGMSYQTFYDQLSPYGSWIDYPGYGYVWVPQVNEGFSPYMSDGHWVYSDMGWTWVSDYPWGWAAFHYGRWFRDPDYGGWLWMPGYDWAPAWVNWGVYGNYYCWTPIGPQGYVNSRYGDRYMHHWNCIPREHMGEDNIGRYVVSNHVVNHDRVDFERNLQTIHNQHSYNRSVFNSGPRPEDVRKVVGHDIQPVHFSNTNAPGRTEVHGNQVNVYRPVISRNNTNNQHAIPTHVVRPDDNTANHDANNGRPNRGQPNNNNNQPRNNQPNNNGQHDAQPHNNTQPNNNQQHDAPRVNTPQPEERSPIRNTNSGWTPPRQNVPQAQPVQQNRPSGGFVPAERPMQSAPMRSAPAPSFHAPSGGGGRPAGGGRH